MSEFDIGQTYNQPHKRQCQRAANNENENERDADGTPTSAHAHDSGNANGEQAYQRGLCLHRQARYKDALLFFYDAATRAQHAVAMLSIGYAHRHGYGVEKSRKIAMFWYKRAAKLGNRRAMSNLVLLIKGQRRIYWYNRMN